MLMKRLFHTNDRSSDLIIRFLLGYVFLNGGIQKFMFASAGVERFTDIGFPAPVFTAYFVAVFEIICGALMLLGLATKLASAPIMIIMAVAIWTTKIPQFSDGFWTFAQAARLDICMFMLALFMLINGAGRMSLDAKFFSEPASDKLANKPDEPAD